jgi:hypothetical protein
MKNTVILDKQYVQGFLEEVKAGKLTGSLTLNFSQGALSGTAQWKGSQTYGTTQITASDVSSSIDTHKQLGFS